MKRGIDMKKIFHSMLEYQKENNITTHCIVNTAYLYDMYKLNSNIKVKAKAVFVLTDDGGIGPCGMLPGHLVLILDNGTIIDPSYEIFSVKNKTYCHSIEDLKKVCVESNINLTESFMKELESDNIPFANIAEKINNGTYKITLEDSFGVYYNKQAKYIKKKIKNSSLRTKYKH